MRNQSLFAAVALIIVAPHLLGGIFAWATLSLALAALAVCGVTMWESRRRDAQLDRADLLAVVLGVTALITLLQALPLPLAVAESIASDAVHHATAVSALLKLPPPTSVASSLDPGRSYERLLYAVAIWAAFCTGRLAPDKARRTLLAAVACSGLLIAVSHLGHRLLDATRVYGLYRPIYASAQGPLLNSNSLAGFLAMTTPVCLGLAGRASHLRVFWLLAATVSAATCVFADSRGGTAVLIGGIALFATMFAWRARSESRRRSASRRWRRTAAAVAIVGVLLGLSFCLAYLAAEHPLDARYSDLSKLDLFRQEWRFFEAQGLRMITGVGRGAFPAVFSMRELGAGRAMQAENVALEYAIEFGLPIAALLLLTTTFIVLRSLASCRSTLQLGGLCGLIAIGVQNLADYSLELTGVAIPAAMCLAVSLSESPNQLLPRLSLRRSTLACLMTGVVAVAAWGPAAVRGDARVLQVSLQNHLYSAQAHEFWSTLEAAAPVHPADPGLAALGAARKVVERAGDARPWLTRAIELAPDWGSTHIWAAEWLLAQREQERALDELARAAELDPPLVRKTLCEWLARAPYAQVALRVAPKSGVKRRDVLDGAATCLPPLGKESAKVDAALLAMDPHFLAANLRRLKRRLSRGENEAVVEAARELEATHPREAAPYQIEAQALLATGSANQAVEALERGLAQARTPEPLLADLVDARARAGDAEGARNTVEQLRMRSEGEARRVAAALILLARAEAQLGNQARSLKAARDAYDLFPSAQASALAARAAEALGQTDYALRLWAQACHEAAQYCPSHARLKASMQQPPPPSGGPIEPRTP